MNYQNFQQLVSSGMDEATLLSLCDPANAIRGKAPWVYWPPELYGHGQLIREFGFYPKHLPLIVYSDHGNGVNGTEILYKHELENDAPVFLAYDKERAVNYRKLTKKLSYVIISPTVYYRRKNKIKQVENSKGTIAFPAHATQCIENTGDIDKYAAQLKNLPEKFQPVFVCLHMNEIFNEQYKVFMKHGIQVLTAGNTSDYRFVERFYAILKNFKYSTSNVIGSYASLSIEMGIPFFIYGEPQKFINKGDPYNLKIGDYDIYKDAPFFKYLFDELRYEKFDGMIDEKLKKQIEKKLGIYDTSSRIKISIVLWSSFLHWIFSLKFFHYFRKKISEKLRNGNR